MVLFLAFISFTVCVTIGDPLSPPLGHHLHDSRELVSIIIGPRDPQQRQGGLSSLPIPGTLIPKEILGSSQGGKNPDGGGSCLMKENFLLGLCRSGPWGEPRMWKARLMPLGKGAQALLPDHKTHSRMI